jgi:hypothetical protein
VQRYLGVRPHSHAAEIEPVGIPAGHHGDVRPRLADLVIANRLEEQIELLIAEMNESAAQCPGELRGPLTVPGVGAIILAAAIMEKGE